jgi:sugar phosphate permease
MLLRNPLIYGYGGCYFCLKLIRYSLLFWLPFYLHTALGFEQGAAGYLSTSFEVGGVLGSIGMGYLADRTTRSRGALCAGSIALLALALHVYAQLGQAPAVWHFVVMAVIGMLLFGPDALLSGAVAQDLGGVRAAGTAAGIVNGMGSFGALCQGALTVWVQHTFGWQALFHALFMFALLGGLCLVPTLRQRPLA